MEKRVFNENRYITLYAQLSNVELKAKAEAIKFERDLTYCQNMMSKYEKTDTLKYKKYSEGFSDVLTKVKNYGKDLWRLIKKLLGQLIIFIEEQIVYIFDKAKYGEELINKLSTALNKLGKWGVSTSHYGNGIDFKRGLGGDRTLPDGIGGFTVDWVSEKMMTDILPINNAIKMTPNNLVSSYNRDTTIDDVMKNNTLLTAGEILNEKVVSFKILKTLSYWKQKGMTKEKKLHQLTKDYNAFARSYKEIMSTVKNAGKGHSNAKELAEIESKKNDEINKVAAKYKQYDDYHGNTGVDQMIHTDMEAIKARSNAKAAVDALNARTSNVNHIFNGDKKVNDMLYVPLSEDDALQNFIQMGLFLEGVESILKHKSRFNDLEIATKLQKIKVSDDNLEDRLSTIYRTGNKVLYAVIISVTSYKIMREIYFEYKKYANQLKNAPTSITDNYSNEVCQGVKKVISRSTKGAHALLKYTEKTMMSYNKLGLHVAKTCVEIDKILKVESAEYNIGSN